MESIAVIVNMYFRVSGDLLSAGLTREVSDISSKIRFAGDLLVETATDGSAVTKTRFGDAGSNASPIIGMWRYRHYAGPMAFESYTDDGRLLFRMPMRSSAACYGVSGNDLTITKATGEKVTLQFETRDQELSLTSVGHPAQSYVKASSPWYDIQHLDIKAPDERLRKAAEQMKR